MKKATGKVIKAFRKHLSYTQEFVAEKLNVTTETIANIENGRVSVDIQRLYELSLIFRVPLKDMVTLASEVFENGDEKGLKTAVGYIRSAKLYLELVGQH
ncbi:MAG: helix-turn-helix transcriptional regulator [Pedobacter sp.]|uniref:helix-turn-helix transcriptional regulator n=1 Tax=Pedobacter sp. TaxID=1411316 RepID=UPI00280A4B9B|nr:helix-turn-helix transcriptional regulator [Pedobacter sp.]MDQ8003819.1 helix-turn-helix transcriptional regulator [Pedobacter sp.]